MKRSLLAPALAFCLASSPAFSQDLDAEVVRNPDDTVTYTIQLDGPPGGGYWVSVFMFEASLFTPYQIPGVFGEFYFNPLTAIIGPTVVLDPQGQGALQFNFPSSTLDDTPIYSQALVVDAVGQLAASNLAMWYHLDDLSGPGVHGLRLSNGSLTSIVGDVTGTPGTQVRIDHLAPDGGLKGSSTVGIGPGGQAEIALDVFPFVQFCDTTLVFTNLGSGWNLYRHIPWHQE